MPRGVYLRKGAGKGPAKRYKRAAKPLADGPTEITLSPRELQVLKRLGARLSVDEEGVASPSQSAFVRAMALGVGQEDVALGDKLSFGAAIRGARNRGVLDEREFNYTMGLFSPGVGLPAISVLWIKRTA